MFKQYLKQAWALMKQNRFYTAVYILGTGLAIAMVMVMAIVYHIRTANIAPEVNRDRILIVSNARAFKKDSTSTNISRLSYKLLKECFYPLKTPQFICAAANGDELSYSTGDFYSRIAGSKELYKNYIQCTDANFWKVFHYTFLQGKPYSEEEFQSGVQRAVLSESLTLKLFKTLDVIGKTFLLNDVEYRVSGVVKDVSPIMPHTYAELWVPYTSISAVINDLAANDITGIFTAYILCHQTSDAPAVTKEIEQKRKAYNSSIKEWEYQTDNNSFISHERWVFRQIDYRTKYNQLMIRFGLIAFVFLLVPGINLSGLTSSRMQERISELGIRKAFGANRPTLMEQILTENLLLTLLGGLAGIILSYLIVWSLSDVLLNRSYSAVDSGMKITGEMLFNLPVFFAAFGFCFLLNIISSYIPVRYATHRPIVDSIHDK